jgi:hypothetical protein
MHKLEPAFRQAMLDLYQRGKDELGYSAVGFLRLIGERGPVSAAKYLVNSKEPASGFTYLWKEGGLGLTVEALIAEEWEKWRSLFDNDQGFLDRARKRLIAYGYRPRHTVSQSSLM